MDIDTMHIDKVTDNTDIILSEWQEVEGAFLNGVPAQSDPPECREPDCFQDGKELSRFLGQIIPITEKEGGVLLGYMEGHGYVLGCREGRLYRGDWCCTKEEGVIWETYTVHDAVEAVRKWNFQMIEETADEEYEYIKSLKEDEKILDALGEKAGALKGLILGNRKRQKEADTNTGSDMCCPEKELEGKRQDWRAPAAYDAHGRTSAGE